MGKSERAAIWRMRDVMICQVDEDEMAKYAARRSLRGCKQTSALE